jgi:uncharacterized membrane protein YqjE
MYDMDPKTHLKLSKVEKDGARGRLGKKRIAAILFLYFTALTTMGICNMLVNVFWVLTCTKCDTKYTKT